MLMDLFYSTLPPRFQPGKYGSTRIHFHSFMLDVLHRQHDVGARHHKLGLEKMDAMPEVARSLAAEGRVLCFDEFQVGRAFHAAVPGRFLAYSPHPLKLSSQVTDIVTAMILRQLLERLMGFGVVCVMTSKCVRIPRATSIAETLGRSRHPDELYKNGIQRSSFIPAIDLLKERFEVVDLNSETGESFSNPGGNPSQHCVVDYRKLPRALSNVYYHPLNPSVHGEMTKLFKAFAPEPVAKRKIPLWGRELVVPVSYKDVAKFQFADLCDRPLSAADYLEVTGQFGTVFVEGVPRMGLNERDTARRFITFIDGKSPSERLDQTLMVVACYENKVGRSRY